MGYFITFEGIDGVGKTTQVACLADFLVKEKGKEVCKTHEPGGTGSVDLLRKYLLYQKTSRDGYRDLLLFSTLRLLHIESVILPALQQKKIVLCDRFIDSTWVYQAKEYDLDFIFVKKMEQIVCRDLVPNLTFVLDLPIEQSLERIAARHQGVSSFQDECFESGDRDLLEKRRNYFLERALQNQQRYHIIDASRPTQDIAKQIKDVVVKAFGF